MLVHAECGCASGHAEPGAAVADPIGLRAQCSASDLLRWIGLIGEIGPATDALLFPMRRLRTAATLIHEGSAFESLYLVGSGTFKCIQTEGDGYEQVQGFAIRGDVIGLDGLSEGRCDTGAIALEDSTVAIVALRDLDDAIRAVPAFERLLLRAASRELRRKNMTLQAMAAVGAEVRVARFLLQMTARQAELGFSGRRIRLRMSRRDIGSHLGIAHETVSRSLTTLAELQLIKVEYREVEIIDPDGLHAFQQVTRNTADALS